MSGHNKWSKIKRKKGAADAKRSKAFSRVIKEISVAVKEGKSGDPDFNPRLRLAVTNAKGVNMPKENVERAIKKALESGSKALHQPHYEGYGNGGVAIYVECTTDNTQRTVSNVRSAFNKRNGNLATTGSVDFLFERKAVFTIMQGEFESDDLELELIDGGAEEIDKDDETNEITVTTAFEDFGTMQKKLEDLSIETVSAIAERIPTTTTRLSVHEAKKVLALIEALEDLDDVVDVFHNMEMTDELELALNES